MDKFLKGQEQSKHNQEKIDNLDSFNSIKEMCT